MPAHSYFSPPSGSRTDRVPLDTACSVRADGRATTARVIDISLGGLGLNLAFEDAVEFAEGTEGMVEIDGIGHFEIECRWVKGNRLGARFLDETSASQKVQAYFNRNGLATE